MLKQSSVTGSEISTIVLLINSVRVNVFPGSHQHNGLDQTMAEIQKVQSKIQQLDYNLKTMAKVGFEAQPSEAVFS